MNVSGARGPQSPAALHCFISIGIGAAVPMLLNAGKAVETIVLIGLWLGFHVFVHVRARRARGVFIDEEAALFYLGGAAGFLIGVVMASACFVVFG